MSVPAAGRRVVMIGLDAAELGLIESDRARLPHLDGLLRRGTLARLGSTAGDLPGSVWPTFYAGALPGVHGIYHHLQWDADGMCIRRVSDAWLPCDPFWLELERRGRAVASLDVPMLLPSRLARGVDVVNWGSHDQLGPLAAPPALKDDLVRRFGRQHPMGAEIPVRKTPHQLARIRRDLIAGARVKGALARWLWGLRPWDLFVVVFGETHRGGHILWPTEPSDDADAVRDVYRAVDTAVGALLDALPPASVDVVLFALHGMGPNTSQEHFVPPVMDRVNAAFAGTSTTAAAAPGIVRWLRERVPAGIQNAIARAAPVHVRDEVMNRQITGGHDWAATPGLALLADLNGYLRWNVRGRERDGCMDPAGRALGRYVDMVRAAFRELRVSATGEDLVDDVMLVAERFPGPRSARLPDALVTWSGVPPAAAVESERLGAIAAEIATGRGGNHRNAGFCVAVPDAGRPLPPLPAHIADLAGFATRLLEAG